MIDIPEGREIHDPEDTCGIMLDEALYGEVFVRKPIPKWWGELGRYVESQLFESLVGEQHDDTIIHGRPSGE